jgi:hypothetical protein
MNKRFSVVVGAGLILAGGLGLAINLAAPLLGYELYRFGAWRLWPLVVIFGGLLLVVPPLLVRDQRGLGALYIPGIPVLVTGGILLFCSFFDAWNAWAWLWPLEVLGVALGFAIASIYMRTVWLALPAIIVGANGLLLQFCAITGLWGVWAALWTIEPLSVGLALALIGAIKHSPALFATGAALSGLAGAGLIGMTAVLSFSMVFPAAWIFELAGPVLLIVAGILFMIWRPDLSSATASPAGE